MTISVGTTNVDVFHITNQGGGSSEVPDNFWFPTDILDLTGGVNKIDYWNSFAQYDSRSLRDFKVFGEGSFMVFSELDNNMWSYISDTGKIFFELPKAYKITQFSVQYREEFTADIGLYGQDSLLGDDSDRMIGVIHTQDMAQQQGLSDYDWVTVNCTHLDETFKYLHTYQSGAMLNIKFYCESVD